MQLHRPQAPETRYPYSASLQYNHHHFCGGALVAPNVVVTAAHCTTTPAKVTLGRYDLDDARDLDYEVLSVVRKVVHPGYDEEVVANDLALLVLERDSAHPFARINANRNVPADGEELAVMGWGDIDSTDGGQETSDELREAAVAYLPNDECEESEGYVKTAEGWVFGSYAGNIQTSMLCAHDRIGTTSDACQGDSGGALVKTGPHSSADKLVGLVSWGFGCADPNFPGVYTRLSAYYDDFLRPNICKYSREAPSYLNCNSKGKITGPPTSSPEKIPEGLLSIFIDLDPYKPEDLGWELTSVLDGKLIASRAEGYYAKKNTDIQQTEEVIVDPERFYRFTVFDRKGNGFQGQITVVRGKQNVKSDALVWEPGFTEVSGFSVDHGFYVGDDPQRYLTLDLIFDRRPESLAWSITNTQDDLPLGFKWFKFYGKAFISASEIIPVYGDDQGSQEYVFTVLDRDGNGMCCLQGSGSFLLYLGNPDSGTLIASGGDFTTDQSFTFEINSAGLVLPTPPPSFSPTQAQVSILQGVTYYMMPATGICQADDQLKPAWVTKVFADFDRCCEKSWNRENCLAAKPYALSISTPTKAPTTLPPVGITSPVPAFNPVTGSFTCKSSGMACTILCSSCETITYVTSGMTREAPSDSTIIYRAERGTDEWPDDPSRLVLVDSGDAGANVISCDPGCTCAIVDEEISGCGIKAQPILGQSNPNASSGRSQDLNCGALNDSSLFLVSCILLFWTILR